MPEQEPQTVREIIASRIARRKEQLATTTKKIEMLRQQAMNLAGAIAELELLERQFTPEPPTATEPATAQAP